MSTRKENERWVDECRDEVGRRLVGMQEREVVVGAVALLVSARFQAPLPVYFTDMCSQFLGLIVVQKCKTDASGATTIEEFMIADQIGIDPDDDPGSPL